MMAVIRYTGGYFPMIWPAIASGVRWRGMSVTCFGVMTPGSFQRVQAAVQILPVSTGLT
jgi:hypothetical protein